MRVGLIGAGGMASTVLAALAQERGVQERGAQEKRSCRLAHLSLLVRSGEGSRARALLARYDVADDVAVHTDVAALLGDRPDIVAECAGHDAVRTHGAAILRGGCSLVVISIGALADPDLHADLEAAATDGAQLILPPGAVGGIDALAAARLSGLQSITYVGRKPPAAWRGTPAETLLDLSALTAPAVFFRGTAREAARTYPQNANVAATLGLAAGGFDRVRVELIADPGITRNVHEVAVRAGCTDFTIRLEGKPSPDNPKTSLSAGYSVARTLLNHTARTVI